MNPNSKNKISQTLIRVTTNLFKRRIDAITIFPSLYGRNHSTAEATYFNGGICGTTQKRWDGQYNAYNVFWYKDYDGNYQRPDLYSAGDDKKTPDMNFVEYWKYNDLFSTN